MAEHGLQVVVKFPPEIPLGVQGPALLTLEKYLRLETGLDCRVFKERMGDDSKLRVMMTKIEKESL